MAETPETPPTPPTPPQPEDTSPSLEPLAAVAEVPLDLPQLQLPTGRYEAGQPPRLHPGDLIWESLRSAFIVDPSGDNERWVAFSYVRSQRVDGHPRTMATAAHTNIPRHGDSGLPKDWEMLVTRWRAVCDAPLVMPILNFASETTVEFQYNSNRYGQALLLDILMAPRQLSSDDTRLRASLDGAPVHMREALSYEAVVACRSSSALAELREYLRSPIEVGADLERLERIAQDFGTDATKALAAEIARVRTRLSPPRPLTCWIHIEGYLRGTTS